MSLEGGGWDVIYLIVSSLDAYVDKIVYRTRNIGSINVLAVIRFESLRPCPRPCLFLAVHSLSIFILIERHILSEQYHSICKTR